MRPSSSPYVYVPSVRSLPHMSRVRQVHVFGMKVGLKNIVELVPVLVDYFDFAVNDECNKYNECDVSYMKQRKPYYTLLSLLLTPTGNG